MRSEKEIRNKIEDSIQALKDYVEKKDTTPEEFFTVARQATFLTALFWVIEEPIPEAVTKFAVPIIKKMSETQAKSVKTAEHAHWAGEGKQAEEPKKTRCKTGTCKDKAPAAKPKAAPKTKKK
jgi:hypothetical protein